MNLKSPESRRGPVLLIVCTLAVVLSPIQQNWMPKPQDNFPLSHYPMFSALRGSEYSTPTLVAINAKGEKTIIPYHLAGGGGLNEVRRQVRTQIDNKKAKSLCRKLARRIARKEDWKVRDLSTVQVITATHNIDGYFAGNRQPVREKIHASCAIQNEVSQEARR